MPLLRLFPGRPRSTFFSSSFFFGAILLLSLTDEVDKLRGYELVSCGGRNDTAEWDLIRSANADLAAGKIKEPAFEVKR